MSGLKIMLERKFPIKINCVPIRGINEENFLKLVEIARENEIDVRFIELMPIGSAENFQGIATDEIFALIEKNLQGPSENFKIKNFVGRIGFLKPCLNFGIGLDVKKLLRNGVEDEKILKEIEKVIYNKPREHNFEKKFW